MDFSTDETFALDADARDPLRSFRERFHYPCRPDGSPLIYFCGHSLGLQPRAARDFLQQELDDWARLGVEAHFRGKTPWFSYHEIFREPVARLVGALPGEVVVMNSLTVNLHLMLATFYRPGGKRFRILTDEPAFPSDRYALESHLRWHGQDPADGWLAVKPRPGEHSLREDDIVEIIQGRGPEIALVFLNGVNFFTGQFFDLERIVAAARQQGCVVGLDLAHAVGNVPLRLHDWQVDFAVWCHYKYVNAGPGAVGGCFVHEKHGKPVADVPGSDLPRLAGWWGNDPASRFQMPERFVPRAGADGWQVSNPPILALAPLRASLALFDEAGMAALRAKSQLLTSYLEFLLQQAAGRLEIISPPDPARRGCQLSIQVNHQPRELAEPLKQAGVICDFREPNIIRIAPVPLYNSFQEVWTLGQSLARVG